MTPSTDPLLARWPHRLLAGLPVVRETGRRDAATAAAIEAYLSVATEAPKAVVIRL